MDLDKDGRVSRVVSRPNCSPVLSFHARALSLCVYACLSHITGAKK